MWPGWQGADQEQHQNDQKNCTEAHEKHSFGNQASSMRELASTVQKHQGAPVKARPNLFVGYLLYSNSGRAFKVSFVASGRVIFLSRMTKSL